MKYFYRAGVRGTLVALVVAGLSLTGCSTLVNGTRQEVNIDSKPKGASVFINNQSFGQTPTVAELQRDGNYTILLEMPGFEPYEIELDKKWSTMFFVNIPVLGWAIDAVSGAMYKLTPDQVMAVFQNQQNPPSATESEESSAMLWDKKEGAIYITVVMEPDPAWQKIGQLTPLTE
jgi:hypothetical protein